VVEPTPIVKATPIAEPLDEFLLQVVQTLHSAVNQSIKNMDDDPQVSDMAFQDCKDIIGTIMAGNVKEWIS
jgi:hypothetical protein